MSHYYSGPAVGVGDGTLLVGWPCRLASLEGTKATFNLVPHAACWHTGSGRLFVVVIDPVGNAKRYDVEELQFDPKWERP